MKCRAVVLCVLWIYGASCPFVESREKPAQKPPCSPLAEPSRDELHVLFIGNSYTYFNNLPGLFAGIAASCLGTKVDTDMVVQGGATLRDLWLDGRSVGRIMNSRWDYVVLQEHSTLGRVDTGNAEPGATLNDPAEFEQYACRFAAVIRHSGARPVLLGTWARKTHPQLQADLSRAYQAVAAKCSTLLAPAGEAWKLAMSQRPQLQLYQADGSHPTPIGSYLAASVLYAELFHASPEGAPTRITGVPVDIDGVALRTTVGQEPTIRSSAQLTVLVDLNTADAIRLQRVAAQAALTVTTH